MSRKFRQVRQPRQGRPQNFRGRLYVYILCLLGLIAFGLWLLGRPSPSQTSAHPVPILTTNELYSGELQINADDGWSQEEKRRLRSTLRQVIPKLIEVMGPPAKSGPVTIIPTQSENSYVPSEFRMDAKGNMSLKVFDEIHLWREAATEHPAIIAHELAHYFRNRLVTYLYSKRNAKGQPIYKAHQAFEEGMAEAVGKIVRERCRFPPSPSQYFESSSGFDRHQFRFGENIDTDLTLYPLRMTAASWVFEEWERRHPGFLRRYHGQLQKVAERDLPLSILEDCLPIANQVTPGFSDWYNSKEITNPKISPGTFLWVAGDREKVGCGIFRRDKHGKESPVVGETIDVKFTNVPRTESLRAITDQDGKAAIGLTERYYTVTVRWKHLTDTFSLRQ